MHLNQCIDFPTVLVFNFSATKPWLKMSCVQQHKPSTSELSMGILKQCKRLYYPATWILSGEWKFHSRTKFQHFIMWLPYHFYFQVTYVHQLCHSLFWKDVRSGFVIALLRKKKMLFEEWQLKFQRMLQSNAQSQISIGKQLCYYL